MLRAGLDRARWAGVVLAAAAACGSDRDPVARSIGAAVERELGVRPRAVQCRGGACELILADGTAVPVRVDGAAWETAELLDPRPIADRIAGELEALGAAQAVDCGSLRPAPAAPMIVECRLGGGGAAWATIDLAGAIDVELALTAAIAAERRTGPGDDALEALSRALDTDEAEGDDDDDRDAPDAGPVARRGAGG